MPRRTSPWDRLDKTGAALDAARKRLDAAKAGAVPEAEFHGALRALHAAEKAHAKSLAACSADAQVATW